MALFVTEYASLASDTFSTGIAAALEPALAEQAITISGTSAASAAFNTRTCFVMLHAQEAVCLKWGTAPTAVTTAQRMAAGETRFVGVPPGQSYKVAGIAGA
jgi:hypothetical protein